MKKKYNQPFSCQTHVRGETMKIAILTWEAQRFVTDQIGQKMKRLLSLLCVYIYADSILATTRQSQIEVFSIRNRYES